MVRFINLLIRAMKLEVYFLTYRKPFIRFGMKAFFIKLKKMTYQINY